MTTETHSLISKRRRQLRMSQSILAGAALVSRSTVQRAERGLPISDESLRSLRAVLGITEDTVGAAEVADAPVEPCEVVPPPVPQSRWRGALALSVPVCLGLGLFGVAWSVKAGSIAAGEAATRERQAAFERAVASDDYPVVPVDVLRACARAVSVKACIDNGEAHLRAGGALWKASSQETRGACLALSRRPGAGWGTLSECLGQADRAGEGSR